MIQYTIEEIIQTPMDRETIKELYLNNKLKRNEWLLLSSLKENGMFLKKYMLGIGEYSLNYNSLVSQDSYFNNIPEMLSAFYTLYEKYSNYHFDKILEEALNRLSNDQYCVYQFLNIFELQFENELKGNSPFKVTNKNMLENCRINLLPRKEIFKTRKEGIAKNRENGYYDVIKDINQKFIEKLNYDIFEENPEKKQY